MIDERAIKAIEKILKNGNDAKVKRKGSGVVVIEEQQKIKYSTQ